MNFHQQKVSALASVDPLGSFAALRMTVAEFGWNTVAIIFLGRGLARSVLARALTSALSWSRGARAPVGREPRFVNPSPDRPEGGPAPASLAGGSRAGGSHVGSHVGSDVGAQSCCALRPLEAHASGRSKSAPLRETLVRPLGSFGALRMTVAEFGRNTGTIIFLGRGRARSFLARALTSALSWSRGALAPVEHDFRSPSFLPDRPEGGPAPASLAGGSLAGGSRAGSHVGSHVGAQTRCALRPLAAHTSGPGKPSPQPKMRTSRSPLPPCTSNLIGYSCMPNA